MDEKQIVINAEEGATSSIEVKDVASPTIEVTENQDDTLNTNSTIIHNNLSGRNADGAHKISAITNLRQELNSLNTKLTPQTLYSDKYGQADYYQWAEGKKSDSYGYFVSMAPDSSSVQICDGQNAFGITVNNAAFVGGYNQNGRDNTYALVATSGFIDVRCEEGVGVGNCVVPNNMGMASVSTSGYGYKVVAIDRIENNPWATIAFNIPIDQIDQMGANVNLLNRRMDDAMVSINGALETAAIAVQKAEDAKNSSGALSGTINGIYDHVKDVTDNIPLIKQEIEDAAEKAKDDAKQHANELYKSAIADSNDKWEDANVDSELDWESDLNEYEKRAKAWEEEFEKKTKAWEEEFEKKTKAWEEEFECWDEDVIEEGNISREEYQMIMEFYRENYDYLTQEEKEILNKKIGQYNGQIVKGEIERAEEAVKKTRERIPSIVKGFISVFK